MYLLKEITMKSHTLFLGILAMLLSYSSFAITPQQARQIVEKYAKQNDYTFIEKGNSENIIENKQYYFFTLLREWKEEYCNEGHIDEVEKAFNNGKITAQERDNQITYLHGCIWSSRSEYRPMEIRINKITGKITHLWEEE